VIKFKGLNGCFIYVIKWKMGNWFWKKIWDNYLINLMMIIVDFCLKYNSLISWKNITLNTKILFKKKIPKISKKRLKDIKILFFLPLIKIEMVESPGKNLNYFLALSITPENSLKIWSNIFKKNNENFYKNFFKIYI
jgi:hypothetical protein